MNQYGKVFQSIRLNKGLKVSEVAEGIVSPQFLRKFEKDESDITITKLFQLLAQMNLSIDEFMFAYYAKTELTTLEKIEEVIDQIILNRNKQEWQLWLERSQNETSPIMPSSSRFNYFFEIILKQLGNRFFGTDYEIDLTEVYVYLESVESWGQYDFFLATYTQVAKNKDRLRSLWYQSFSKRIKSPIVRRYSIDFYLSVCIYTLAQGEIDLVKTMLAEYRRWQEPEKILQNLSYNLVTELLEGIIMILEDNSEGVLICRDIIYFMKERLGYQAYAEDCHHLILSVTQIDVLKETPRS